MDDVSIFKGLVECEAPDGRRSRAVTRGSGAYGVYRQVGDAFIHLGGVPPRERRRLSMLP